MTKQTTTAEIQMLSHEILIPAVNPRLPLMLLRGLTRTLSGILTKEEKCMAHRLKFGLPVLLGGVAMLFAQAGQWGDRPQMSAADAWPKGIPVHGGGPSVEQRSLGAQPDQASNVVRTPDAPAYSPVVSLRDLAHRVPRKAMSEFEKARKAQQKGELVDSIAHLIKAVSIDPEFYDAVNNLGSSYLNTKRVQLAIEQFNKAIKIGPHKPVAYTNLCLGLLMQGKFQDAERAARQAVNFEHGGTQGPFMLGYALVLQEKFTTEAEQSLRKAATDFPDAVLMLVPVLAAKGDMASARDHLLRYLATGDRSGMEIANQWMKQLDGALRK
jgi:tetratricopeptide (TPR) repeat protein